MSVEPMKMKIAEAKMTNNSGGRFTDQQQGLYSLAWFLWHDENQYKITELKSNRIMGRTQYIMTIQVDRPVVADEIYNLKGKTVGFDRLGDRYGFEFPKLGVIKAYYSTKAPYDKSEEEEELRTEFARVGSDQDIFLNATVAKQYLTEADKRELEAEEAKPAPKEEAKPAPKEEAKPAPKEEAKPAPKEEAKPAPKKGVVNWRIKMTVKEMIALLRENGKSGYSGKTKAELIAMIEKFKLKG